MPASVAHPARLRLAMAGLFVLALTACKPAPERQDDAAPKVRVAAVAPNTESERRYTGEVRARTQSSLGFRVAGKVSARLVDPGDKVKAGQALMRLDPTDFELARAQARANVEAARVQQVKAAADEKRATALVTTGAVSRQGFDQARAAARAATAELEAARAQARQTDNQAQYTTLTADADGVITQVPAEPGQVVAAGQTVVEIARNGAREAVIALPENVVAHARTAEARASLYTAPQDTFAAQLRELSASADPVSRSFEARYTLMGDGADAPLGATVTIALAANAQRFALRVPVGALYDNGKGPGVWRIGSDDQVQWVPVSIEQLGEEWAVLAAGGPLEQGQQVVALGAHLLNEGQKVQPITAP